MDLTQLVTLTDIALLKPHPRNYREHPEDEIQHIIRSIEEHGFYRNIILARDYTILAGHGVVQAARQMGQQQVPALRLDLDPDSAPALRILIGDNEIGHLGMPNDRLLSDLLKELKEAAPEGLRGTGFDEQMLSALVFITRPEGEIRSKAEAGQWVGMPEFGDTPTMYDLHIRFSSAQDREQFVEQINLRIDKRERSAWQTRWPWSERDDLKSLRFEK